MDSKNIDEIFGTNLNQYNVN